MNWTGGRLQQASKGGNNRLVTSQKQHFARARTKLQNGHQQSSPFRPPFWDSNELQHDSIPSNIRQDTSRSKNHIESQQRTLYDYEATAPVAWRLASLTPVPPKTRRKRGSIPYEHDRNGQDVTEISTATSAIGRGRLNRSRMIAVSQVARSADLRSSGSNIPNSETRVSTRRVTALGEDDLESQRQKLLNQPDWMRLKPGRPLQIHFPPTAEKERIGKRRKLSSSRHTVHPDVQNDKRIVSPFQIDPDKRGPQMSGALQRHEDIKIRIGPDALLSQVSSRWSQAEQRRQESSDTMLLDGEWTASQLYENNANARQAESVPDSMLEGIDEHGQSNFHLLPDATASEASISEGGQRKSPVPMAHPSRVYSPHMRASGMNKPTRNPTQRRSRNLQPRSYPEAPSAFAKETPAVSQSRGPSLKRPVRLIFQSSSPVRQDLQPARTDPKLMGIGVSVPVTVQGHGDDVWNGFDERVDGDKDWRKFLDIPEEEDTATQAFLDESRLGEDDGRTNAQDDTGVWQSSSTYIDPAGSEHQLRYFEGVDCNHEGMVDATSSEFMGFSLGSEVSKPDENQLSRSESLKRLESLAARSFEAPVQKCLETKKAEPDADELWKSFVFGDKEDSDVAIDDMLDAERTQITTKHPGLSDESLIMSTAAVRGSSSSRVLSWGPFLQNQADTGVSSLETVFQTNTQLLSSSPDRTTTNASDSSLLTSQTQTAFSMYNNVSSTTESAVAGTLDNIDDLAVGRSRFFLPPTQPLGKPNIVASSMHNNVSESSDELSSTNPSFIVGRSATTVWPSDAPPKVVFSKPKSFRGTKTGDGQKIVHLGRTAPRQCKGKGMQWQKREMGRLSPSIYDIPQSGPDDEDEEDSIEGD